MLLTQLTRLTLLTCCSNSSWVGGTDVAEIAYVGFVVDGVERAG